MKKKIAIIDDELTVRETVKEMILLQFVVEIYCFSSVDEFLESLNYNDYSLVLSDIHMPSGSGLILLENKKLDNLPIVFMSGFSDFIPKNLDITLLRKPLGMSDLVHLLASYLEKSA